MSAFYPFKGGGSPKADIVHFFDRFSYMMASLSSFWGKMGWGYRRVGDGGLSTWEDEITHICSSSEKMELYCVFMFL